jgi:hypothetical protein
VPHQARPGLRLVRLKQQSFRQAKSDAPTPLSFLLAPCVIYKDASHKLRSDRKKVRPIFPVNTVLVDQSQVGLVDEGRRLQGVPWVFPAHVAPRQNVKFSID